MFLSPTSRSRALRVLWLRVRLMYISFVGVALAVVGGHGRGWISLVGRRPLIARVFRMVLPVKMLAVGHLVIEMIIFHGVAC